MAMWPAGGVPDPAGLIKTLAVGTMMTGDPFFAITVFAFVHYSAITTTIPMWAVGNLERWELVVRMLFFAIYGTAAGLAMFWGGGVPIVFPTHIIDDVSPKDGPNASSRRRLRIGVYVVTIAILQMLFSALRIHGVYYTNGNFGTGGSPPPSGGPPFAWVMLFIMAALFVWVIVDTARGARRSPLTISYLGQRATPRSGGMILMFALFLMLVNVPQAIWDFGSAPSAPLLPIWASGLIVLAVELLILAGFYFLMPFLYGNMDEGLFSPHNSGLSWGSYILFMATIFVVTDVIYLSLVGSVIQSWGQLDLLMSGIAVAIAAVAGFVYLRRKRVTYRHGPSYTYIRAQHEQGQEQEQVQEQKQNNFLKF